MLNVKVAYFFISFEPYLLTIVIDDVITLRLIGEGILLYFFFQYFLLFGDIICIEVLKSYILAGSYGLLLGWRRRLRNLTRYQLALYEGWLLLHRRQFRILIIRWLLLVIGGLLRI